MNMRSGSLREIGDADGARTQSQEAMELARDSGFPPAAIAAKVDLAYVDLMDGDVGAAERAIPDLLEAVETAKGFHQWLWSIRVAIARAETALLAERWDDALTFADDGLEQAEQVGRRKYAVRARLALGRALLAKGKASEAVDVLTASVRDAEGLGHLPSLWPALTALARARLGTGDESGAADARATALHTVNEFAARLSDAHRQMLMARPDVAERAL